MYSLNRMNSFIYMALFILILASILSVPCDAQVTFSRDWNAGKRNMEPWNVGKRNMEPVECRSNIKSATAICHMLINEIRQLAGCEAKAEDDNSSSGSIFTGKR